MPHPHPTLIAFLAGFAFAAPALASEEAPGSASDKLAGDWRGIRTRLWTLGLEVDVTYLGEAWHNLQGGAGRGSRALDNLNVGLSFDGSRAAGWEGFTARLQLLNNNGRGPNDLAVSDGGISNIEVAVRSFKVYEAWVQQEFAGGRLSLLAGLHDLNSEFYATEASSHFLNPTFGIGTEMAATGDNGPSIFPVTSLAFRAAWVPSDGSYVRAAAYDGVPGDPPLRPRGTHIRLGDGDGALLVAEAGLGGASTGRVGAGVWRYTASRPDQLTGEPARSEGAYVIAEGRIVDAGTRTVDIFARAGFTAGHVEAFRGSWSTGLVFSGFMPGRPEGVLGLAVARADHAEKFEAANPGLERSEVQVELTYLDVLHRGVTIQPDVQYTINPGADPALRDAWTAGVRVTLDF